MQPRPFPTPGRQRQRHGVSVCRRDIMVATRMRDPEMVDQPVVPGLFPTVQVRRLYRNRPPGQLFASLGIRRLCTCARCRSILVTSLQISRLSMADEGAKSGQGRRGKAQAEGADVLSSTMNEYESPIREVTRRGCYNKGEESMNGLAGRRPFCPAPSSY
jgi:hypothetical protein